MAAGITMVPGPRLRGGRSDPHARRGGPLVARGAARAVASGSPL